MSKTTKIFIGMLVTVIGVLVWAYFFTDDYGVIEDYTPADWFEENQLYQDEFYKDQKLDAKM